MVMQDKIKLLDKMRNICFFIVIFGTMILSMFHVPLLVMNILSSICSSVLYCIILLRYQLTQEKMHKGLLILGIICILCSFIGITSSNPYVGILRTVLVYIFYIFNQKLLSGTWNKFMIFFGTFITISSILSIYFDNKWITGLFIVVELILYGRILNTIMTKIGMNKKKKLEEQGFTNEDAKKVPLIRRILFGRTGKLDLSIVEMITGKDLTRKSKKL